MAVKRVVDTRPTQRQISKAHAELDAVVAGLKAHIESRKLTNAAVDPCGMYRIVRPAFGAILLLLKLVPTFGEPISIIVQAVGEIMDVLCGTV